MTSENKLYYIYGRGFHAGYLSIGSNNTRLWGEVKQLFSKSEIDKLIQSIPKYIIYSVCDNITHKSIYYNE